MYVKPEIQSMSGEGERKFTESLLLQYKIETYLG